MSGDSALLLQAVAELAPLMGAAALRHYRTGIPVERKGDGSPVTQADREAERAARAWLAARFPADAILGEEFGEQPGTSGRTWLLDPIDGTKTFARGVPLWGSLVAVTEGETVLAGAAAFPALGELLAAGPGEGCWHDGSRCRVSDVARLADATVVATDCDPRGDPAPRRGWDALARAAGLVRTWGDCCGYLLVATGRAEVMVNPDLHPWDVACFVPIIEEAGGAIVDFSGRRYPPLRDAIATNRALSGEVRRIFAAG